MVKTEAFVIGTIKYGDSSLIVHLFTEALGYRSYLIKGILTSKKGKLKKSYFQPLSHLSIEVSDKKPDRLGYIRECNLMTSALQQESDPIKGPLLLFLCEVLASVLKEESERNAPLFAYLRTTMHWLENLDRLGNFHIKFLIDLTKFVGFYPNTTLIEAAYFDLESGCYSKTLPRGKSIQGEILTLFNQFLGTNFEASLNIKLTKDLRSQILHTILTYYAFHLQGFKQPKSLDVLHEIFELF